MTDGWEVEGQTFPSPIDIEKPEEERHFALCSPTDLPLTSYKFSQNAAMINWRIGGRQHQGFTLTVRFVDNPYRKSRDVVYSDVCDEFTTLKK